MTLEGAKSAPLSRREAARIVAKRATKLRAIEGGYSMP